MLSTESVTRRRTALAAIVLVASAIAAPLTNWSPGTAAGSTPQTITFGPLPDRALNDPALLVVASASSGLPVTFTTTTPLVCSATGTNGANISPIIEGVCTVQADQVGNVTFAAAPSVQQSFNVSKGQQTITFGPLNDRQLNQGPLVVTATASAGGAVVFSTTTPTVCTSSGTHGSTITPIATGTCTVQADQPGNALFAPAPTVTQSFGVGKSAQAITFGALADKSTLQSPVSVSATSSSLLTVTFTTTTPAVCTAGGVNGATITLLTGGTCTVQADQPGDATFSAAAPVQRSFLVTRTPQSITFGALGDHSALDGSVTVSAIASSGLPVTFSTTTPAVCTAGGINGATITLVGAGVCTVQADQAGNTVFAAASPVAQSFTVTKADQTISFAALADRTMLQTPLTVGATASSALVVQFSTATPSVCTAGGVNGTTIALVTVGVCTVEADQAGNSIFNAAPAVTRSFTVTKVDQTISFGPVANAPIGTPITVGATATSGLAVTFATTTPAVCTAGGTNGTTITLLTPGVCTVQADQAGNATYNAAPTVAQSFGVGKTDQTISFAALPPAIITDPPINVDASATSSLVVVFSTTTPAVCTVTDATVTLVSAGTCTIHADQAGDATYNPAPTVARSFAVNKVSQIIAFAVLADVTIPHLPITVHATATSSLTVQFSSTTPAVCKTVGPNGTQVTLMKAGSCVIRADQPGNAIWAAAPPVARHFLLKRLTGTGGGSGYWMLGADGHVYAFGAAPDFGSTTTTAVAMSARSDGAGYWVVDPLGNVRAFGKAVNRGGRPPLLPGELVSTISGTPSGAGYWLFTTMGRAFAFGDAVFYGDMRAVQLNGPIVASVATPSGHGYYMVGSDGGVFSFGDARYHGSMGNAHLNRPIVGLSPTPDNRGYWLVASDGGVFAFDAPFRGSLGSLVLNQPVNGLVAYGNGYLMVASDGGVFDFSDKAFVGSLGEHPPAAPIVGIAAFPSP